MLALLNITIQTNIYLEINCSIFNINLERFLHSTDIASLLS